MKYSGRTSKGAGESSARDMYRGASGQRFFVLNYLGEENKGPMDRQDASGNWVLKPEGSTPCPTICANRCDGPDADQSAARSPLRSPAITRCSSPVKAGLGVQQNMSTASGMTDDVALLLHGCGRRVSFPGGPWYRQEPGLPRYFPARDGGAGNPGCAAGDAPGGAESVDPGSTAWVRNSTRSGDGALDVPRCIAST